LSETLTLGTLTRRHLGALPCTLIPNLAVRPLNTVLRVARSVTLCSTPRQEQLARASLFLYTCVSFTSFPCFLSSWLPFYVLPISSFFSYLSVSVPRFTVLFLIFISLPLFRFSFSYFFAISSFISHRFLQSLRHFDSVTTDVNNCRSNWKHIEHLQNTWFVSLIHILKRTCRTHIYRCNSCCKN
jgi:hypothetical protein